MSAVVTSENPSEVPGLPKHLWPVAQAHGAEMVKYLYAAGIAGHATHILVQGLRGQPPAMQAIAVLVEQFNAVNEAYRTKMGWTAETLTAAEAAIRATLERKIIVPRGAGIILDS